MSKSVVICNSVIGEVVMLKPSLCSNRRYLKPC